MTGPMRGGTGQPQEWARHTHSPLYSPGLPLHIHRPAGQGTSRLGAGEDQGGAVSCPWVGGRRAAYERQMCTDTGHERQEQPLGVQQEMCVVGVLRDPGKGCK
jgi:hypothetical protein